MRATYATSQGSCIRCDACGDNRNSTSRITVWGIEDAAGNVHELLHRAENYGLRSYDPNTLTFEACPSCLTKIARRCDVCGNDKAIDRDHCPDCARAFAVADRQKKTMAKTLEEVKALLAAQDQKHAETLTKVGELLRADREDDSNALWRTLPQDVCRRYVFDRAHELIRDDADGPKWATIRQQEELQRISDSLKASASNTTNATDQFLAASKAMQAMHIAAPATASTDDPMIAAAERARQARMTAARQKETPTMTTTTPKTDAPNLRSELDAAAWRAGIEIATEEGRDLLVSLLTDGMTDDEAAVARPLFAKAFAGRFGVPIVSGAIGGVLHAVQSAGVEIPFVTPATAARIGEEMRVLSASGMMKVVYRSGRDLIAKHGGKMLEAITNLGRIAERTGVRVDPAPAEAEAPEETHASARAFGQTAAGARA